MSARAGERRAWASLARVRVAEAARFAADGTEPAPPTRLALGIATYATTASRRLQEIVPVAFDEETRPCARAAILLVAHGRCQTRAGLRVAWHVCCAYPYETSVRDVFYYYQPRRVHSKIARPTTSPDHHYAS